MGCAYGDYLEREREKAQTVCYGHSVCSKTETGPVPRGMS